MLNEFLGRTGSKRVFYWRDRRGHEIDFVFAAPNAPPVAVECKWRTEGFSPRNIIEFRRRHPEGANYAVTADTVRSDVRDYGDIRIRFMSLDELMKRLITEVQGPGNTNPFEPPP